MGRLIEELDYRATAMGPLILRRRWVAAIDADVIEVILGEEHLMSSLFTVGETELAVRGLAAAEGGPLRVLVGGLGLGRAEQPVDLFHVLKSKTKQFIECTKGS